VDKIYPDLIYVDENDNQIGSGQLAPALVQGIAVRVSRVILTNAHGEVLIQKRGSSVSSSGKWDQSAAGHVDAGESYVEAAYRELQEEMGIKYEDLYEVGKYYTEETDDGALMKRFNTLFTGIYDGPIAIDHDEVSDYEWILFSELDDRIENVPTSFTQGFLNAYEFFLKVGL